MRVDSHPTPVQNKSAGQLAPLNASAGTAYRAKKWRQQEFLLLLMLTIAFLVSLIPAWRHLNSDFPNYYLVARLYREGYPLEKVYDWIWLQRQKDHRGIEQGVITFIPLTLPSALVVAPFSSLTPIAAKRCWTLVDLLFLGLTVALLARMTRLGWIRVGLITSLAFVALRNNFLLGQMHVLVLLLITFAAWSYFRGRNWLCGISLALAAALKLYPGLFLIFFLFKRQWRAATALIVSLAAAGLTSLYVFGTNACMVYARQVLPAALRGETIDPYNPGWGSISALLRRLFIFEPELNPSPVAHLPWLFAVLQSGIHALLLVSFMWAIGRERGDERKAKRDWAIFVFLLLILSSQPAGYHFVALIFTAVLIYEDMKSSGRTRLAQALLAVYALVCVFTLQLPSKGAEGWQTVLYFPRLWMMLVLGGILLGWTLSSVHGLALKHDHRGLLVAGTIAACLTVLGFYSTQRHFRGEFANYGQRTLQKRDSLLATAPSAAVGKMLATVMTRGGYTLRIASDASNVELPRTQGDWLQAALAPDGHSIFAEQASSAGSRLLRLGVDLQANALPASIEMADAESPKLSIDGKTLAFLREIGTRETLWEQPVDQGTPPRRLVGPEYDPADPAFLTDGTLIFSSRITGQHQIYAVNRSGTIQKMPQPVCPARFPAASPDGQSLAYSCLEHGNWQVHVLDFKTGNEAPLTSAECNSTYPAWTPDSKQLIYATDCGRGLGLTALVETTVHAPKP